LPLFGSPTSSLSRLGASECRPMIVGVGCIWRNDFFVPPPPPLAELENYLDLLCAYRQTLVHRTLGTTCPYSPLPRQRSDCNRQRLAHEGKGCRTESALQYANKNYTHYSQLCQRDSVVLFYYALPQQL
jgi:hypothetical protein